MSDIPSVLTPQEEPTPVIEPDQEPSVEPVAVSEPAPAPAPLLQPVVEQEPEKPIVNDMDTSLSVLEARCKRFGIPFDPEKHKPKVRAAGTQQSQQSNVSRKM